MHIVLLAQCITEDNTRSRDNRRYLSAAGRKKVLEPGGLSANARARVSILSNSYAKGSYPVAVESIGRASR